MGAVHDDAPDPRSGADRATGPLAGLDDPVNALHDDLNGRLPWLWWPLTAPARDARLAAPQHALYAVHAGLGLAAAALVAPRRARPAVLVVGAALGLASWALFTGAWDRRADRLADGGWDAYDADGDPSA
jgi:hypothetical protein